MKNEADFKSAFKKSVKAQRGFCLSLAAPMISGIPDLYVVINGFIPVLLEAKWLGEITRTPFSRKVNYSEIQKHWITECNRVQPNTAFGLVGCKYGRSLYSCYIQEVSKEDNYITSTTEHFVNMVDKHFDVIQLFELIKVPKVNKEVITMVHSDINIPGYDIDKMRPKGVLATE